MERKIKVKKSDVIIVISVRPTELRAVRDSIIEWRNSREPELVVDEHTTLVRNWRDPYKKREPDQKYWNTNIRLHANSKGQ